MLFLIYWGTSEHAQTNLKYNLTCNAYMQGMETLTQLLDIFWHIFICSPCTLYTVQFQFTRHSLHLSDNVPHDWLFPYQSIYMYSIMITSFSLIWWLLRQEQLWPCQFCVSRWNKIIIIISLVWLYSWWSNVSSWLLTRFWWHTHTSLV